MNNTKKKKEKRMFVGSALTKKHFDKNSYE